jgi:transposase InsO family protein
VHHSDRGSQYLSIRYTERLTEAGAVTSVGPARSSFDNALAETIIGLDKTELIRRRGAWSRSAMSRRPSSRPHSKERRAPATLLDSSNRVSGEPSAVQSPVGVDTTSTLTPPRSWPRLPAVPWPP